MNRLLATGPDGVRRAGGVEFSEGFFDFIDERDRGLSRYWRLLSTLTGAEIAALAYVHDMLDQALAALSPQAHDEQLVSSGWPNQIASPARTALKLLLARGHFNFSEEIAETEPGQIDGFRGDR